MKELEGQQVLLPAWAESQPDRHALILHLDRRFSSRGIRQGRRRHFVRSRAWTAALQLLIITRRCIATAGALLLFCASIPLLSVLYVWARVCGGRIGSRPVLGRWAVPFKCLEFQFPDAARAPFWARTAVVHLPALFNAISGDLSFVGPRPVTPNELPASERNAWKRFDLRPGFVSLWWLRRRGNIAYQRETEIDAEYVETRTLFGDLGIAVRSALALGFGVARATSPDQVTLLGIPISNLSMAEATHQITALARSGVYHQVCFVNADCVNISVRNSNYKRILSTCKLVLADGIGIRLAGTILNQNIRENVNGTDLLPLLCAVAVKWGLGIFLLGGSPGVPEATAQWMQAHYPDLRLCGVRNGFFNPDEEPAVLAAIRHSGANILLVAFGAPRQEEWIDSRRSQLGSVVCIGVGGLFDFYSGRIRRAPIWMREIGMEWLFRFVQEPRRMWRRYFFGNVIFLIRVLRERWLSGSACGVTQ